MLNKIVRDPDIKMMKTSIVGEKIYQLLKTNQLKDCELFLTKKPMRKYFIAEPKIFDRIVNVIKIYSYGKTPNNF